MKLAWLVWRCEDSDLPEFWVSEPPNWYHKVQQIVYAEVQE